MDELELLKKDWKKQDHSLPHYKEQEIYPMLLQRSSSIVKWIFIISIIELGIGIFLNIFLTDDEFWKDVESIHLRTATIVMYIISYLITFVFIYLFYKNYRSISATDSASVLMKNILKTRKVVKYYILYVLLSTGITSMLFFIFSFIYPPDYLNIQSQDVNWLKVVGVGILVVGVLLLVLWLFYSLLYGLLLKKLKRNYRELKRLELE